MDYTQADVDAFRAAMLASGGALTISFGDQTITFASLEARRAYLAEMERRVSTLAGTRQTYRVAATSKGV